MLGRFIRQLFKLKKNTKIFQAKNKKVSRLRLQNKELIAQSKRKALNLRRKIPVVEIHFDIAKKYFFEQRRPIAVIFSVFLIISLFSSFFQSHAFVTSFYAQSCLGGWQNVEKATLEPEVKGGEGNFSKENSALLSGSVADIFCGNFEGDPREDTIPKKFTVKLSWLLADQELVEEAPLVINETTTPEEIQAVLEEDTEPKEDELRDQEKEVVGEVEVVKDESEIPEPAESPKEPEVSAPIVEVTPETSPAPEPVPAESSPQSFLNFIFAKVFAQEVEEGVEVESVETLPIEEAKGEPAPTELVSEPEVESVVEQSEISTATNSEEVIIEQKEENTSGDFFEVLYTIDGSAWQSLAKINKDNWQKASFDIENPEFNSWDDISKLQVAIKPLPTIDTPPVVYLDSVYVEVEYEELPSLENLTDEEIDKLPRIEIDGDLLFDTPKDVFGNDEDPAFNLDQIKIEELTGEATEVPAPPNQIERQEEVKKSEQKPEVVIEPVADTKESNPPEGENSSEGTAPIPIESPVIIVPEEPKPEPPSEVVSFLQKINRFLSPQEVIAQGTDKIQIVKSAMYDGEKMYVEVTPILETVDNKLRIRIPKPESDFKPGLYKIHLEILVNNKVLVVDQDFAWGVLAINTNKSIYNKDDDAYIQVAALDEKGHTLCDADLRLKTVSPSGVTRFFYSGNDTLTKSNTCGPDNVTDSPDYFTYLNANEVGVYSMTLTNLDNNYEIEDIFKVEEALPYEVERLGATRINPFLARYVMSLNITSEVDFEGVVKEIVPKGFVLEAVEGYPSFSVDENNNLEKQNIKWQVSLKAGEKLELKYKYQAPKISPEIYLLGSLSIYKPVGFIDDLFGGEDEFVFQELGEWALASDAGDSTAFLAWDEDGANNTTPHYAILSGDVLGAEAQMQNDEDASDDTNHTVIEAAPNRDEYIVARLIHLGELDVQVWTEGAWANGTNAPTDGDFTTGIGTTNDIKRGFDVAYEANTGDGLVVYESSSTGDGALKYRVWDGASWANEATIDYSAIDEGNDVAIWIECEGDWDTDNVLCAWQEDANDGIYAAMWDGDSWEDLTQLTGTGSAEVYQNFDVTFEGTSGDGMVAYALADSPWIDAATYTSSAFSDTSSASFSSGAGDLTWVRASGSPNNDYVGIMMAEPITNSSDFQVDMWDGDDWTTIGVPTEDADINGATQALLFTQFGDVAPEYASGNDELLFVWRDGSLSELNIRYMVFDVSAGQFQAIDDQGAGAAVCNLASTQQVTSLSAAEGSNGPCAGPGSAASSMNAVDLNPDPATNDIMAVFQAFTAPNTGEMQLYKGDGVWLAQDGSFDDYEADMSNGATPSATNIEKAFDLAYRVSSATNVAVLGTQTSSMTINTTGNYLGGAFAITTSASGVNVDGITIAEQGTVDGTLLDNIKLYYESDTVSPYNCASVSYGGSETQYGSTDADGFSSANGTAAFSYSAGTGPSVTSTSALCVYVVFDVHSSASAGETIEIQITDPSTAVVVDTGSIGPTYVRAIAGTTTLAAATISVGGTCDAYDQTTDCGDLGTIRVAFGGTLQGQTDTGGGTSGLFSITGLTAPASGTIVTVFVDGAASAGDRAVAITEYDGSGSIDGMKLFKEHLTIGSNDTGATLTSAELGSYDNSVSSGDDDVFFDYRTDWSTTALTATGGSVVGFQIDCDSPATSCTTFSSQEELHILSGWTYRPDSAGSDVVVTHDVEIVGTLNMDDNDLGVTGSFINSGTFTKTSGQEIIFGSTSTGESINSGGSAFHDVTFNGSGGGWTAITSAVAIDGLLTITAGNYDTGAVNNTVTGATSITGTLTVSSTTGTKTFTGNVTVNSSGTWNETAAEAIEFAGDLTNNQTFTASTGVHTFSGTSKALAGTLSIPNVTVTGTLTNNGTLTVSTDLAGSGTLTQGASDTLNIGGTSGITTLTATASGNTVSYTSTGAAQTIKGTTYYNLTIDKSGQTGTLGATTAVDGALTITAGTLQLSTLGLTVTGATSISGTLNDNSATGTNLFIGAVTVNNGGTWTTTNDPAFTFRGGLTVNSTSTFTSGAGTYTFNTNAQTVAGTQTYTITAVQNDVTSGTGLTFSGSTATVTTLTQGSNSILTFSGSMPTITTLTATASGNTVRYTSTAGAQTVKATTYVNVEIDKSGQTATLGGATTLTGNMTITAGTLDVDNVGNYALNIGGNWSNSGTFTARAGTVTLNTATTATVTGATTFWNLTITHTAAKEVNFSTTGAHIIQVDNTFSSTGSASNLIKLYSTSAGTKWHFKPLGTATVDYVDTKDGGCESGSVTVSKTNWTNSGNNEFCWGAATLSFSISSASIALGTITTAAASFASHTISAATNAAGGFVLTYLGPTLTRSGGAQTISAYSSGTSSPGTEGFGINLKDNATPNVGANPVTNSGTCTVASNYNTADTFHYVASSETTLTGISAPADCVFTVSYVANISNVTEAGNYSTDITYIVTGTF